MKFEDTFYGRSSTVKTYYSLYSKYIKKLDPARAAIFDEHDFRGHVNHWLAYHKLAPNTVKILIRLLSKYIVHCGGKHIDTAPFVSYSMKSRQKTAVKALNKDEAIKLLDATRNTKLEVPVALGMYAGLRRGEVWGLMKSDVDFVKQEINIHCSYSGPTKSGLSRIVPISKALRPILIQGIVSNNKNERIIPKRFDPNPKLKETCLKINIPVITFHGLRHTFATQALEQGRSLREVADILGHASVSTTADVYWNVLKKMDMDLW